MYYLREICAREMTQKKVTDCLQINEEHHTYYFSPSQFTTYSQLMFSAGIKVELEWEPLCGSLRSSQKISENGSKKQSHKLVPAYVFGILGCTSL